jgi:DNA-binding MarR family transcriptional regulator
MSPRRSPVAGLGKADFETLSAFRFQLTRFLRFSERAAKQAGMLPLQYLLLLHLRGYPRRDWATVGELAERLQSSAHGTAALVSRCEAQGYVERTRSSTDGRRVEIRLTRKARAVLNRVAALHREELRALAAMLPGSMTAPMDEGGGP